MKGFVRSASMCFVALGIFVSVAGCKASEEKAADPSKTDPGKSATNPQNDQTPPTPAPPVPASPQSAGSAGGVAPGQAAPAQGAPSPASPAQPLTPSGPPAQVVAKVNGEIITRGVLDFTIKSVMREGSSVPPDKYVELRRSALDDLINRELVYQKAKASSVAITDAELAGSMSKVKSEFADEKTFTAELAKDGMTPAGIEAMVRRAMVVERYVRSQIVDKIKISPVEETKFYTENKEKMKHPEQVRASHILLLVPQGTPAEQKQAQKTKAEDALARARKGEDFTALAKQYSQDSGSSGRGGDLGFFGKGQMVPVFEAAAWPLKPGEIAALTESQYGYHVIKVTERRAEGYYEIADVKEKIRDYLTNQKAQGELQTLTQSLRAQGKVESNL